MKAILFSGFFVVLLSCGILPQPARAQPNAQAGAQYRGFWVDTFNTALNHHTDVLAVVNNAKRANCNALFVQVRRRGDSWYRNSLEPLADRTPLAAGFDPLADLIAEAHAQQIEVHAFVIIGAIWNGNPGVTLPQSAQHVFNRHGFDQAAGRIYTGRANWLTRTLLPDDATITFNGQRFGGDFWIDLGHPDAAQYTYDVLLHLVRNYDLDGLHLDRIRYPEVAATLNGGANVGYNETNVARYKQRFSITLEAQPPAPNDAQWQQWRRNQVTNFVRRVYLNAVALKPQIKISAATIVFGGGPTTEAQWTAAEAYWRVFQDWRAWTEEGILDVNVPMNYKREHTASQVPLLDTWAEYIKNHNYDRTTLHGLGVYLNSIEGSLRQIRKAVAPSQQNNRSQGVVFFSHAVSNEAVTANPFAMPPNQDTPRRSFAEFAAALTTGKSVNGASQYESASLSPVFATPAPVPVLPWKAAPQLGQLMGIVKTTDNQPLDTADVQIARVTDDVPPRGRFNLRTATDGNGFYGGVEIAPGAYRVVVTHPNETMFTSGIVRVVPGVVTQFDLLAPRANAPQALAAVSAASFSGTQLAPDSISAAFGVGLSTATAVANETPLPTQLAGVSVRVRDSAGAERLAPLFFVSPSQINFLLPAGTAPGVATLTASNGAQAGVIHINAVAPGLFTANANGQGVPAAVVLRVKADGAQVTEPLAQFDAALNRFVPVAIDLGAADEQVFLILFGTGWRGRSALARVQARIGDAAAEVLFAGAQGALVGLDQINVRLPRALAGRGEVEVLLFADNFAANAVQVRVK